MPTCRSCQAEVLFVPSAKTGRPMILDATPEKRVVLTEDLTSSELALHGALGADIDGRYQVARVVSVYTDHHATCPAAGQWKGRSRRDPPAREPSRRE